MTVAPAAPLPVRTRPATPAQLDWLSSELALWRASGLVDDQTAGAILASYHPSRRFDLSRLLLTLGAGFVGVGILWLVASNLDELSPLARFLVVSFFWLAFLVTGELLAGRREHGGDIPSPVVGSVRILAALTFGAVVMQAAQSLQVPAYEPQLLAWWGLGALVHAYAVRAAGPLAVGLLALAPWLVWQTTWDAPDALTALLVLFSAGAVAASVAALHATRFGPSYAGFSATWRELGALVSLGALFVAALPYVTSDGFAGSPLLVLVLVAAGLAVLTATAFATDNARLEPVAALVIAALGVLLVLWDVGADFDVDREVGVAGWAHAALGVVAYVAAAAWFAVLGVLRDSRRLTFLATAALVVFTTVQAFSVFAAIVQGAWLFLLLGLVFAGTGWVADRARRQLARSIADGAAGPGHVSPGTGQEGAV
jgi:uncharacterized membrane protein